jgi:signal peptidase I
VKPKPGSEVAAGNGEFSAGRSRIWSEVLSWFWVGLAFFLLEATVVQARMIPSGSMENTILVGDHLIVSRAGYNAGIPFTRYQVPLWREPSRQQIIVFNSVVPNSPDLIKRVIGLPGDRIKIVRGRVYVNGSLLNEPYARRDPLALDSAVENFPPRDIYLLGGGITPAWAEYLSKNSATGEIVVPAGNFFAMGDNRDNSYDSRYWGFVPRSNIIGTPVIVYMSINAQEDVWDTGRIGDRFGAYLDAAIHPSEVRWGRLFHRF